MHIICLTPVAPGVYNDHCADHITAPPDGWAYIPEDFPLPSTFPRLGSIEAENMTYIREMAVEGVDGEPAVKTVPYTMMTVTVMTEGTLPELAEDALPTTEQRVTELEEAMELLLSGVTE